MQSVCDGLLGAMASRNFTPDEVLAFLDDEEEVCEELDDEIFMAGSDEEFDVLDDIENGKIVSFIFLLY